MSLERKAGPRFLGIAGLLGIASAASIVLALDRLGALDAPGCGPAAACRLASSSEFGSLPLLRWPLSYVGCGWFAALLVSWVRTRGEVGSAWIWLARVGGAASLFWLGVLAGKGLPCPYCISAHVANLLFLLVLETPAPPVIEKRPRALRLSGVTAAVVALVLFALDARFAGAARSRAEDELRATTNTLRTGGGARASDPSGTHFTGRHRRGSETARARFVVLTDFQCEECREFEGNIETLLAHADDVSLAIRHYPLCKSCNPRSPDLHPNACWAARAAEAASIVAGDDGYWKMHRWLFAHGGSFTEADLDRGLTELGFARMPFLAAMHSDATLARVREDIDLGQSLGLTSTPMIFVNGVELRGWKAEGALDRTLTELRQAPGVPAATADRPPSARERFLEQWRHAQKEALPSDTAPHVLGPREARAKVVLFGDYQEPFTCEADVELRDLTLRRGDVSYSFRPFPVNRACNPAAEKDLHPLACLAALGAEAVGLLQGEDGFWAMHDWIVTHRLAFDDATLTHAAEELGLDRDVFWKAMTTPELPLRINEDASAAKILGLTSIPLIFVNGKRVENWKAGDESLLPTIVAEAAVE